MNDQVLNRAEGIPKVINDALKESLPVGFLRALNFSAQKHRTQRRKDSEKSPYINHPIAVAHLLATVGEVFDSATLTAALLHDTIEDTETTREELDETFGVEIRELVDEVTDDKEYGKQDRKKLQIEHAPYLSRKAKLIKLADLSCNLADVIDNPPAVWPHERRCDYLAWTEKVIAGCRGTNDKLEQHYDGLIRKGRQVLPCE